MRQVRRREGGNLRGNYVTLARGELLRVRNENAYATFPSGLFWKKQLLKITQHE
jgi:hypothetical protein